MTIYFGLELDDLVFPQWDRTQGGIHHFGPQKLLYFLEAHLGLIGHPANNEYLRIEQYRQALQRYLDQEGDTFYRRSFSADQLAAATTLLSMRDDLLLSGWDFQCPGDEVPERLQVLSAVESYFTRNPSNDPESGLVLSPGYADRFCKALQKLDEKRIAIEQLFLNEPLELLPSHLRRLFRMLEKQGTDLQTLGQSEKYPDSDLGWFQKALSRQGPAKAPRKLKNDGSLLILRAKRETDAAHFLARLFRRNPAFRPLCLLPEKKPGPG